MSAAGASPAVRVRDLSVTYRNAGGPALRGVSVDAAAGEIVVVMGATGSGKSFLLNVLVTHLQQYDPVTVVLDLGHSYRKLAGLLEGGYLELGLGHPGLLCSRGSGVREIGSTSGRVADSRWRRDQANRDTKVEMLADRFARMGYPLEAERTRTLGDLTWKRLGQLRDHQRQLLHQG